jgi:hypothetical protein
MPQWIARRRAHQLDALRTRFAQADGLPFADVLSGDRVERALDAEQAQWRERVYTPLVTLWAFLSQVLCPDGSCRAAVARVLAWLVARGRSACSRPAPTARPAGASPRGSCGGWRVRRVAPCTRRPGLGGGGRAGG